MKPSFYIRKHPYFFLLVGTGFLLVFWEIAGRTGAIRTYTWSMPSEVTAALYHDLTQAGAEQGDQNIRLTLLPHIARTVGRFVFGFLAAGIVGVGAGFLLGISKSLQAVGHPVANVLRSLPSAAIWPITAATIGYGTSSQMFVVIFGAAWPILIYSMNGVVALRHEVYDSLHFMWLEWYRRWWVLFLWSLPAIVTGLEVGCSIAFLLTVTVEFFYPASGGLGWYLDCYRQAGTEPDRLFAGVFLIGLLGWASNTAVHISRRRLVFWESTFTKTSRHRSGGNALRILDRVHDIRRRNILSAEFVTNEIEAAFKIKVQPKVLFQGPPYMYPEELHRKLGLKPFQPGVLQRDIIILVPSQDGPAPEKVVLFARSWIIENALRPSSLQLLNDKCMTIGTIVRQEEADCGYKHLWYRELISQKLGRVFSPAGGAIELIERARIITIRDRAAIFIEEFVPV